MLNKESFALSSVGTKSYWHKVAFSQVVDHRRELRIDAPAPALCDAFELLFPNRQLLVFLFDRRTLLKEINTHHIKLPRRAAMGAAVTCSVYRKSEKG